MNDKRYNMADIVASTHEIDPDLLRASQAEIAEAMATHQRAALTFSGGKDSLASLYLLRPWCDRVKVLGANAGDPYPKTVEQMERIRKLVPHFVEVAGPGYIRGHAPEQTYPADMVPLTATPIGRVMEISAPRFKSAPLRGEPWAVPPNALRAGAVGTYPSRRGHGSY